MAIRQLLGFLGPLVVLAGTMSAVAQPQPAGQPAAGPAPLGNEDPVLRLEGQGPLSPVCASAFSPDGGTLYEAGWDKVVRRWRRDPRTARFALDARASLRIPIGPGDAGVLNALAVSADGRWLAVAGNAVSPETAGFRQLGLVVPKAALANPWSLGSIYVFDLNAEPSRCRMLAGHPGSVKALAFAATPAGQSPLLLSAGSEPVLAGTAADRPLLVLRLWDVAAQVERDRVQAGTYLGATPWLAAWSSPAQPGRIRVAAAWRDQAWLAWDVGAGPSRRVADPFQGFGFALAQGPGQDELVTAHFGQKPGSRRPEGFLAAWNAGDTAAPTRQQQLAWPGAGAEEKAIPVALALVASRPGGARDLAAVVVRRWTPAPAPADGPDPAPGTTATEYRLQLVDLAPGTFGAVKAQVPLWTGPLADPLVSAAADGRQLAIVGHPENEVHVYDVGPLLENRADPQRLRGVGDPVGVATFARRGADWGVRIRRAGGTVAGEPPPPLGPDDVVLDVSKRQLAPAPGGDGWALSVPALGGWQSRLVPPRREAATRRLLAPWTLWLYDDGRPVGVGIPLTPESRTSTAEDLRVTGYALLPPRAGLAVKEPIVAVALYEPGVGPTLWLYNGLSGERVRQLSGHTGTIRSVAFSGDGRLLVSGGDDRTACVWSLTDLDRVVHVQGALTGLVLSARDGRYVVSEFTAGRGAPDLRAGDVVEGLVEGGRLVPLGSVHGLHFTASGRRPGQVLILRRRRGAGPPRDVAVVLGQAADERKPLFTLFLSRPEAGAGRDWLAWNPFGPYDASGPAVESLFGWHFNAFPNPAEPARFALANQYPQFRREGLLADLIAAGRLVLADPEPPIARPPAMELFVDPVGQVDGQGRMVVDRPPSVLGLSIDDAVPAGRIQSVTWQLDDEAPRPMRLDEPDWSADLAAVAWDRLPRGAPHRLTVVLTTNERSPQRFTRVQRLLYVPRPRLTVRTPAGLVQPPEAPIVADHVNFRLAADVQPASNARALVTVTCRNGETVVFARTYGPLDAPRELDETIALKPGSNRVTIEARNADGLAGLEAYETARFGPLTVGFHPDPVEPPTIGLDALTPLNRAGEAADAGIVPIGGSDGVVVEAPRVRLTGAVRTKDTLLSVERSEDGRAWQPVAQPPARGARSLTLGEELALVADRPTTVHIRARAVNGMGVESTAVETLRIEYRPALPVLEGLAVDRPGPLVVPGSDGEPPPLVLSARVVGGAAGAAPVEAAVLLGDEVLVLDEPPALDLAAGTFRARVRPRRGRNEIRVRLRNAWHTAVAGPVFVDYRRPPKVETAEVDVQAGRPSALVSAFVVSPTPLTGADVEVAARSPGAPAARIALGRKRDAGDLWVVSGAVPIEPGENTLIVRVHNEDGPAAEARRSVRYEKPVPPKPEIALVETPEAASVSRPRFVVKFLVRSTTPLERLEVVRDRAGAREVVRAYTSAEWTRGERIAGDVREWAGEAAVALEPAVNALRIVAVNAGGEATKGLDLTYTCPPVRVEALEVVPRSAPPGNPTPEGRRPSPPQPLTEGRASLRGQVVWIDEDPQRVREVPRVQVWVNGFPQVAAELGPVRTRGREQVRDFRAEVLMSRTENQVEVKLRDLPLEIQGQPRFPVACRKPDRNFQLHLLVISIGTEDERALRQRAVAALKGREVVGDEFLTPAFSRARIYGPHCPRVPRERINGELFRIRRAIRMDTRASNEVVMLFYQGIETFEDQEPALRLSASNRPGDVYRLSDIRRRLEETRGAKLFLLDVTHVPEQVPQIVAETGRWIKEDSPFGLIRFSLPGDSAPAPADASLAVTLRDAVRDAITLGQVNDKVKQRVVALRQQFPGALYDPELTPPLEALVIGGP